MIKSTTENKLNFKRAQEEFTEFGIQHLTYWTKKELSKYKSEPVVIPFGNHGFFVGTYKIQGIHSECWEVSSEYDNRYTYCFLSKSAAILYCLYNVKQKYKLARELLDIDTKLGRLDRDVKHFEHSLRISREKGDKLKTEILLNRYIDAKMQRRTYQNILKKTINSAKYMNFGNQTL